MWNVLLQLITARQFCALLMN